MQPTSIALDVGRGRQADLGRRALQGLQDRMEAIEMVHLEHKSASELHVHEQSLRGVLYLLGRWAASIVADM